jgi:hypothetical protein
MKTNKYKAMFIIPKGAIKKLTDIGWIFESKKYYDKKILDALLPSLGLMNVTDMDSFNNEEVNIDIFYIDDNNIESIYIRDFTTDKTQITKVMDFLLSEDYDVEVFIP